MVSLKLGCVGFGGIIHGPAGAFLATAGIFLPSFFIAFYLHRLLRFINRHALLRSFLDIVNAASVALIASVAIHMTGDFFTEWRSVVILAGCLPAMLFARMNAVWLIVLGSIAGYLLLLI